MSAKRKVLGDVMGRRVRARREASEEIEEIEASDSGSQSNESEPERKAAIDEEDSNSESEQDEDDEESDSDTSESPEAAQISFGALAKAHASLTAPSRKSSSKTGKPALAADGWEDKESAERKAGRADRRDFNRSSKHAPTEISSKKAVSRKREVVPVLKREVRDPRFEILATGPSDGKQDEERTRRAYGFLDDYREDEMKEIKNAIKTTRDEEAKEKLKRALLSMESRKKAQARKDKENEIISRHRMEEREKVKAGKQPFYLKKAEQKKRMLTEQFEGLKGKQLDKVMERRRKKVEGKEKKKMPFARREVE